MNCEYAPVENKMIASSMLTQMIALNPSLIQFIDYPSQQIKIKMSTLQ